MTVSIIIAVKTWQKNLEECVNKCLGLKYPDLEIIVLPDKPCNAPLGFETVRIIPTGAISPAYKRDIGAKHAGCEILAFLDDDAYPQASWLINAVQVFRDHADVSCVCGPAVTPFSDSFLQKTSGLVYTSFVVSAGQIYRYIAMKQRLVVDYPSCNFLIRKDDFDSVGGFNTPFWPGEDTILCLKLFRKGKKMLYSPDVLVYHHRRKLFLAHLAQVRNYALHRGYFARKFPDTSLRWDYFIPSVFVASVLTGALLSWLGIWQRVYIYCWFLYSSIILAASLQASIYLEGSFWSKLKAIPVVFLGIISTHIYYGIYFIKGWFSKQMPEERSI